MPCDHKPFGLRLFWCLVPVPLGAGAALILLLSAGGYVRAAQAAPLACAPNAVVTNANDSGAGSLRQAASEVCWQGTVTFSSTLAGATIFLSSGEVLVTQSVTIDGSAAPGVTLDAQGLSRIIHADSWPLTLTALSLINGSADFGGAVYANNAVVLTNVNILTSTATGGGSGVGGGLYAAGDVSVTGGRFQANQCLGAGCSGGGLYASFSSITMSGTQVVSNTSRAYGGGLVAGGAVTLTNSLFQGNVCDGLVFCYGGGIYSGGQLFFVDTEFIDNTSLQGGGALTFATATVKGGTFRGNQCLTLNCKGSGGLEASSVLITGTAFIDNSSQFCGGGLVAGIARITDGHFKGNQATAPCYGGGVSAGTVFLRNTDFLSNTALHGGAGAGVVDAYVEGGLFAGNQCLSSICRGGGLRAAGLAVLTGTQFAGNTAALAGGGLWADDAVTVVSGGFQRNACSGVDCWGGGLYVDGWLTMTSTALSDNTSTRGGGGAAATGPANVTNGLFHHNGCSQNGCWGGGLVTGQALQDNVPLTVSGTLFTENFSGANSGGGGGALVTGAATIVGSTFERNNVTGNGAGLVVVGGLVLADTQFLSNTSAANGGGVIAFGMVTMDGGRFQNNQCTVSNCRGGGLWAGAVDLTDAVFVDNRSASYGGGLFINTTGALRGVVFRANRCLEVDCQGGAVYTQNDVLIDSTTFVANTAGRGGGVFQNGGAGTVVNTLFARNGAPQGAALYLGSLGSLTVVHTTIATPTLSTNSAIYLAGNASITNTIIASYTLGIAQDGSTLAENFNLYEAVATPVLGNSIGPNSQLGQAHFMNVGADDYHLNVPSAAIDAGLELGVAADYEGDPRPQGSAADLGFDEALGAVPVRFYVFLPFIRRH